MSQHSFLKENREVKSCPKCGSSNIKRSFYNGKEKYINACVFGGLKGLSINYLIVRCECGWEEKQKTLDDSDIVPVEFEMSNNE